MKKLLLTQLCLLLFLIVLSPSLMQAQTQFNGKTYYPFPTQEILPPTTSSTSDINEVLVRYIADSQEVIEIERSQVSTTESLMSVPMPNKKQVAQLLNTAKNFGPLVGRTFDDLLGDNLIASTTKLFITFPSGAQFVASGSIIGSRHVVTAGRCVYLANEGGFAEEILIVPGYVEGLAPFGFTTMKDSFTWSQWRNNGDLGWDMGLITMDKPLGFFAGGLAGALVNVAEADLTDNDYDLYSYPSESFYDGEIVHSRTGSFDDLEDENIASFNSRTFAGEEGAVAHILDADGAGFAGAVVSNGSTFSTDCVTFNNGRFDDLVDQIVDDVPNRSDLIPIGVRTPTAEVEVGGEIEELTVFIENYGNQSFFNIINVDFYLSENDFISEDDILIASASYNAVIDAGALAAFTEEGVEVRVPDGVISGDYFLGAIITNTDSNEENNNTIGFFENDFITITGGEVIFSVSPTDLNYEAVGGSQETTITSNISYTLSTTADWLTLSSTSGNGDQTVSVTAAENTATTSRTATITVMGEDGSSETITVTQVGAAVVLGVSPTDLNYEAVGGSQDAAITSNISYTLSTVADWLTLSSTSGNGDQTLSVTAAENTTTTARTATITVMGEDGSSQTITVTQAGAAIVLDVSPNSLDYTAIGGDQDVSITSNTDYQITTSADWITFNVSEGNGDLTLTITTAENTSTDARTGTVVVFSGSTTRTVTINQAGQDLFLTATPNGLNYTAAGGDQNVDINSNISYTISTDADWLTLSSAGSEGNLILSVNAATNPTTAARSATITILSNNGITQMITVNQAAANVVFAVSPESLNYEAIGGSQDATIMSNISYTLSTTADWLTLSSTSGNGDQTVSVTAAENTATTARTATITVMGEDGSSETITVTQVGAAVVLGVSPTDLNYEAAGGSQDAAITSNISYTLSTAADWLTLSNTSGNSDQTVSVTAAENTATTSRTATITVMGEDGSSQTITVTQAGAAVVLGVSPTDLNYAAAGGSQDAAITSNISYTLSTAADWLTLSNTSGNGNQTVSVTATENTATTSRTATITVMGEDGSSQTITVTQEGVAAFVSATPDILNYTALGGDQSTVINANVSYTIATEADWLSLSVTNGSGMQTLVVTAAENTVTTPRTATITVMGEAGVTQTITVNQAAAEAQILATSPDNLNYTAPGGDQNVNITANVSYSIATTADWLTLSATGGDGNQTLTVTAAENTATTARTATITVSGEGLSQTITVSQAAASFLMAAPDALNYDANGGDQNIQITGNVSYSIMTTADWLTLSSTGGEGEQTLSVTAAENTTTAARSATITISGEGLTQTIQVNQAGVAPSLVASPNALIYESAGGSQNAMITANVSYSITTAADWLTLSSTGGEGNQTLSVTATENTTTAARTSTIEITGEGLSQTIQVTQNPAGVVLIASPTNLDFMATGGTADVALQSNVDWTVENNNDWFTVSPMNGSGDVNFTVTATENTSTAPRAGDFTITGNNSIITITVNQAGAAAILTVSPDILEYESAGGMAEVTVTSNVDWTVMTSDSWFSVENSEGSGNASFMVTATENTSTEARSGMITFTGGGITFTVTVNQNGTAVFLTTSPQNLEFGTTENCSELNIQSNTDWTINTDIDWITSITPMQGSGSMAVTICYATNETTDVRTGTITISTNDLADVEVNVSQAGAGFFINVNPQTIQVPATSGVVSFDITSNTNWVVTEEMDWFDVSTTSGEGNSTIDVTYDQNFTIMNRQGMITVSIDGQDVTVMIIQSGAVPSINVQETEFSVDEFEGCIDLLIFANSGWTVSSDSDWITSIEPASGGGNGTVTVCYAANSDTEARNTEVIVEADADISPISVNITQAGMTVGLEDVNGNDIMVTTYPNPATEVINWQFSAPLSSDVSLEIISVDGQLIENNVQQLNKGIQSYQLTVNRYAAGIYFYRLIGEEGATSGRFMVVQK